MARTGKTIGFKRIVKISPHVHSEGERQRQLSEAIQAAAKESKRKDIAYGLVNELKPHIVNIVKRAFIRYAQCRTLNEDMIAGEWQRFNRILNRML